MTGKIHWRCFHCGDAFTKAQEQHARLHFGCEDGDLPVCQMRLPGEHHLLTALRNAYKELRRHRAEDADLMRAIYGMAADHATALRREEERGYEKGLADGRELPREAQSGATASLPKPPVTADEVWRPIESAPRDGALFIATVRVFSVGVFSHHDMHIVAVDDETGEIADNYEQGWRLEDYEFWRPLPAPPRSADGEKT
jgi:hypothetical protein